MGLNGIDWQIVWYETSSGHTLEIAKNINGENIESPVYEYAIAA